MVGTTRPVTNRERCGISVEAHSAGDAARRLRQKLQVADSVTLFCE